MRRPVCLALAVGTMLLSAVARMSPAIAPGHVSAHTRATAAEHQAAALRTEHARAKANQLNGAPARALMLVSPFGPMPTNQTPPIDDGPAATTLSRAEAQQLEDDHDGDVVRVSHGCCGAEEPEVARGIVHGLLAARDLRPDAPVLIEDGVPSASHLAARLRDDGLTRVLLVVEP